METRFWVEYCLGKSKAYEDYPFGPEVIVIKIVQKMFALFSRRDNQINLSLKCDPDYAEVLRRQHQSITPGYHLHKRHWNTIILDGSLSGEEIKSLIDHSYDLVVRSLPKAERSKL